MTSNLEANGAIVQGKIKEAYEQLARLTDGRGVIHAAGSACGEPCSGLIWHYSEGPHLKWGETGSSKSVELVLHDHPLPLPTGNNSVLQPIEIIVATSVVAYDADGSRVTTSTKASLKLLGIDDRDGDRLTIMRTDDHAVETTGAGPLRSVEREFGGKSRDYPVTNIAQLEALLSDARKLVEDAIG